MNVVIADCCEKSGKTTLALNLSAALAQSGSNVLLVDADPDGQLDALPSLSETGKILDRQGLQMLRYTSMDRLQVVTGMGRRLAFQGLPEDDATPDIALPPDLTSTYDWVIFDTSMSHRSIASYVVGLSDRILAPIQMEPESLRHVPDALRFFLESKAARSDLKFEGFVRQRINPSDGANNGSQSDVEATLTAIRREFPKVCLDVEIPFDDTLAASSSPEPAMANTPEIQSAFSNLAQELTMRVDGHAKTAPKLAQAQMPTPASESEPDTTQPRSWWRRLFK